MSTHNICFGGEMRKYQYSLVEKKHRVFSCVNCLFCFQCSTCGKHFSTIYNLNSHLRLHDRPLNEVCTVEGCGEMFPTKRQLDMHMKNHEGLEKTYK